MRNMEIDFPGRNQSNGWKFLTDLPEFFSILHRSENENFSAKFEWKPMQS